MGSILEVTLGQKGAVPVEAVQLSKLGGYPDISPDGRWLAFWSTETGSNEMYVKPVAASGPSVLVSHRGGYFPRWAPDGRKLYWIIEPSCEYIDWSVDGTPETEVDHLWDQQFGTISLSEFSMSSYMVSRPCIGCPICDDGVDRFGKPDYLKMITNWFQEFESAPRRRVVVWSAFLRNRLRHWAEKAWIPSPRALTVVPGGACRSALADWQALAFMHDSCMVFLWLRKRLRWNWMPMRSCERQSVVASRFPLWCVVVSFLRAPGVERHCSIIFGLGRRILPTLS